jgi:anti-sigma-K factor RskA
MTRDEIKELGALYAVGALDPATTREVESFLRAAPEADRQEIEELRQVAALLPLALPAASVPAHLRSRLLARLATGAPPEFDRATPEAPPSNVVPLLPRARPQSPPAPWLLIAATVTLAVLSGLLFWQNSQLMRERSKLAEQVARQTEQRAAREQELNEILAPSARVIPLAGAAAPQASAKLVWDTARHEWVVYIHDLPGAPPDKDYQLWYITADQSKISAQVFRPDAQGRSHLRLSVPPEIAPHLAAAAVTLEPQGGSAQPTGEIFLQGAV